MTGDVERPDPSLRISDADREQVAEVLREAAGEGRIDFAELDERLDAAYSAKVYGDLLPIVADLPGAEIDLPRGARVPVTVGPTPAVEQRTGADDRSIAILGSQKRRGVWHLGRQHMAFALLGDVVLDLRQATLAAAEVEITANAIFGDIDIIVNEHTRVIVDGTAVLGDFGHGRDRAEANFTDVSPTVRVKGMALFGDVKVVRRPPAGSAEDRWFRRSPRKGRETP